MAKPQKRQRQDWTFPAVRCGYCGRGFACMMEYLLHVAAKHDQRRQRPGQPRPDQGRGPR
jgi:hypothetical protein